MAREKLSWVSESLENEGLADSVLKTCSDNSKYR